MFEEQTTPNERKEGTILVAFGGGGPGGVEGLGSSFVLEVESNSESDMVEFGCSTCLLSLCIFVSLCVACYFFCVGHGTCHMVLRTNILAIVLRTMYPPMPVTCVICYPLLIVGGPTQVRIH
jgi:hypothetical protein